MYYLLYFREKYTIVKHGNPWALAQLSSKQKRKEQNYVLLNKSHMHRYLVVTMTTVRRYGKI